MTKKERQKRIDSIKLSILDLQLSIIDLKDELKALMQLEYDDSRVYFTYERARDVRLDRSTGGW